MRLARYVMLAFCFGLISVNLWAEQKPTEQPKQTAEPTQEYVTFETNMGKLVIQLYSDKAPLTVRNFLRYVDKGFYDDTIIHRIVPNFVIQGGGYNTKFAKKPTLRPIRNESDNQVKNYRGTLSMARTNNPHSATTQFFINLADNPDLDWRSGKPGYTVFGEIISGMSTVDSIAILQRGKYRGALQDAPNEMVIIERAYRSKAPEAKKPESTKTKS